MRRQPLAELVEYPAILPGLAGRFDHFIMRLDHEARVHIENIVDFQPVRRRQDDIGVLRHRPHELVYVHEELQVQQRRHHLLGVGQVQYLLPAHAEPYLDHRIAAEQLLDDRIGVGGPRRAHLELVRPHDALPHLFGDGYLVEEVLPLAGLRGHPGHHAARPLDVPRHSQETDDGPQRLAAVRLPLQRAPDLYAAGRVFGEEPRRFTDIVGFEPGDVSHAFRGVFLHPFLELVEAVGPVPDELLVP